MKKKLTLMISAAALVALLGVGGTLAWFTDTETATNIVTMGNVDINIIEVGNGKTIINNEREEELGLVYGSDKTMDDKGVPVTPGAELEKKVTFRNIGKNDAYLRAKIYVEGVNQDYASLEFIGTDTKWELKDDGYYYYKDILPVRTGEAFSETANLITGVKIPSTWDNTAVDTVFKIQVFVEAMQADNVDVGGATGFDATMTAFAQNQN